MPRIFGYNAAVEQRQLPGLEPVLAHADDLLGEHDVVGDDSVDDVPMKRPLADIDVDERIRGLKGASLPRCDQQNQGEGGNRVVFYPTKFARASITVVIIELFKWQIEARNEACARSCE